MAEKIKNQAKVGENEFVYLHAIKVSSSKFAFSHATGHVLFIGVFNDTITLNTFDGHFHYTWKDTRCSYYSSSHETTHRSHIALLLWQFTVPSMRLFISVNIL